MIDIPKRAAHQGDNLTAQRSDTIDLSQFLLDTDDFTKLPNQLK